MTVTQVGTPSAAVRGTSATTGVTPTISGTQTQAAGDKLVAIVTATSSSVLGPLSTGTSGWTLVREFWSDTTGPRTIIGIFEKVATGSGAGPTVVATGSTGTQTIYGYIIQLNDSGGSTPQIDAWGVTQASNVTLAAVTTTTVDPVQATGSYAISVAVRERAAGTVTWTPGTGFTNVSNDSSTNSVGHTAIDVNASPTQGSTLSNAGSWTSAATTFGTSLLVVYQPTPASGLTVQATFAGTSFPGAYLRVRALTHASQVQTSPGSGHSGGSVYHVALTTTQVGSRVFAIYDAPAATAAAGFTAETGYTAIDSFSDPINNLGIGTQEATSATASTGSTTVGATNTFSSDGGVAGLEVKSDGGTISNDSGTPALAYDPVANNPVTQVFKPSGSCLLVAFAFSVGTSATVTDSSGLTWTKVVDDATDGDVSIWTAYYSAGATGAAALSGSGSLTTSPAFAGAVSLAGLGSLTGSPVFLGAATFSGLGSLAAPETIITKALLSGVGSLSAPETIGLLATMSGIGSLTAPPGFIASAALAGLGSLSAAGKFAGTASMTGAGSFSASPLFAAAAALSGLGSLAAAETIGRLATMSGLGSLSATVGFSAAVALTGLGSLGEVIAWPATMAGAGTFAATAAFGGPVALTGLGTLAAPETIIPAVHLTGLGSLTSAAAFAGAAVLAGAGSLTAVSQFLAAAALSGVGTLTGTGSQVGSNFSLALTGIGSLSAGDAFQSAASLAGAGTLVSAPTFAGVLALAGLGSLAAVSQFQGAAVLAGLGTLGAASTFQSLAALSGAGTLAGGPAFAPSVALSGAGLLVVSGVSIQAAAALSGVGLLHAGQFATVQGVAALSGLGSLAATASMIMNRVATMSGAGSLRVSWAASIGATMSGTGLLGGGGLDLVPVFGMLSGSGTLSALAEVAPPTVDYLWLDYERKRDAYIRLRTIYRETVQAGGTGLAGRAFTEAWEANRIADEAYGVWLVASGAGLPVQ